MQSNEERGFQNIDTSSQCYKKSSPMLRQNKLER